MTISYFPGTSFLLRDSYLGFNGFGTNALMDATAEKIAMIGNVVHPTVRTGTIAIRKIHFSAGAITLNAASQVRVSLQNVSQTAGPPYQPDGTQDQFYDFKTATTALTQNAWNNTGNLSADRTVDFSADSGGDANSRRLAVVWEYQVFTAADSVIIRSLNDVTASFQLAGVDLNTGSWANLGSRVPIVVFECSDGTFAFFAGCAVQSANSNQTVSSTGSPKRAGLKFKFPFSVAIDRLALSVRLGNGADGRLVLYDSDGTTELRSVDIDNDDIDSSLSDKLTDCPIEPVTLLANTFYRMVFVSSTTTTANVNYMDVNAVGHMDGLVLGQNAHWTQHDGTSWTDTTTRRPFFGLGVAGIETGSLLLNSGMQGGLRG